MIISAPVGSKFRHLVDFGIYNRWGELVYYSDNYMNKGWDGNCNGIPQKAGVYFFTITVASVRGKEKTVYKGDVTLIR